MEPQTEFDNNIELLSAQYPEKKDELQEIKQAFLQADKPALYKSGDRILQRILNEPDQDRARAQIAMLHAARNQLGGTYEINPRIVLNIAAVIGLILLALYYFGP